MRICLLDIETSFSIVGTFSLYPESINHENILSDWYIITAAWKFLDSKKIHSVSGLDSPTRFRKDVQDDYHVVKTLRDVLDSSDIWVGHNLDKFDIKKFNARLIYHNLPPLKKITTVDTLKEAKKIAAFSSNRLDYLGKHLCGVGKMETSKGLWLKAMAGDKKAIREMEKYNKVDVQRLEDVYLRLRKYMKTHPNVASPDTCNCPRCGGDRIKKNGTTIRASGLRYQSFQCLDCGGNYHDKKSLSSPNSRI